MLTNHVLQQIRWSLQVCHYMNYNNNCTLSRNRVNYRLLYRSWIYILYTRTSRYVPQRPLLPPSTRCVRVRWRLGVFIHIRLSISLSTRPPQHNFVSSISTATCRCDGLVENKTENKWFQIRKKNSNLLWATARVVVVKISHTTKI